MFISIVIPVFNEKENVAHLYGEIRESLNAVKEKWEIIFVDDGSIDGTWNELCSLGNDSKSANVKLIRLARNFGQTTALGAGIDAAGGEIIITMDGDLQNDPKDIPILLAEIANGADVVSGWRKKRKDAFFSRRLPSMMGNKIIAWQSGVPLHDFGCSLKAYKKDFIKSVKLYGEMHRLVPALIGWMGAKISEVEVNHRPREAGKSKYSLKRVFAVILDLISLKFFSAYATRPTHIIGMGGIISIIFGIIAFIVLIAMKILKDIDMTGNPFLIISVMLQIVGLQLIALGLLGEINVRAYYEILEKHPYKIKETKDI